MNYPTSLPHSLLEFPLENHDEFQNALTTKCARLSEDLYGQSSSPGLGLSDKSFIPDDNAGQGSYHHQSGSPRKAKVPKIEAIPGYLCFSLSDASIKAPAGGPLHPYQKRTSRKNT